ncbi:MAG: hypothetical protein QN122_11775 [Armatimonadota bacterium]|nr:hypothetical protein [Armatimonadota bacterium]MDR7492114.1 hypothetical protein [Armatimonadota bacterium]
MEAWLAAVTFGILAAMWVVLPRRLVGRAPAARASGVGEGLAAPDALRLLLPDGTVIPVERADGGFTVRIPGGPRLYAPTLTGVRERVRAYYLGLGVLPADGDVLLAS